MHSIQIGALSLVRRCPGGYEVDNTTIIPSTQCRACPPGTYHAPGVDGPCVACGFGSVAPGYGSSSCTRCPNGTYALSNGTRTTCQPCADGTTSAGGADVCCSPLGSCEQPLNASVPNAPYWVVNQSGTLVPSCTNRMNVPANASRICRAADPTKCQQQVNCSGLQGQCPATEILSVVNVTYAQFSATRATSVIADLRWYNSPAAMHFNVTGVTTSAGCAAVPPSGYFVGVAVPCVYCPLFGFGRPCSRHCLSVFQGLRSCTVFRLHCFPMRNLVCSAHVSLRL